MEVRRIRPEELVQARMIQTVAFNGKHDFSAELNDPMADTAGYEQNLAAFVDGEMAACMCVLPYEIMLDGQVVPMAGIGGVATLPEYRNAGCVRRMFAAAFDQMREEGVLFSYLYPFSYSFYRKFGYESCYARKSSLIKSADFSVYPRSGRFVFFKKGDDIAPYRAIYEHFISGFNLAAARRGEQFRELIDRDPYSSGRHTYLWLSDAGEAKAYATIVLDSAEHCVEVRDIAWCDREGMCGIMSLFPRYAALYPSVRLTVPPCIDHLSLVGEHRDIETRLLGGGMNRIVDAGKVLALLNPPQGEGEVTIKVDDGFLKWNDHAFKVRWAGGELAIETSESAPDMALDITALTKLVFGYITPDQAELSGEAAVYGERAGISALFPAKMIYLNDFF